MPTGSAVAIENFAGVFSRDTGEETRNAGEAAFHLTGRAIAFVLVGYTCYQLT